MLDEGSVNLRLGDSDLLVVSGDEVLSLLEGTESEIIQIVKNAYQAHSRRETVVPFSSFLLFPHQPNNRIIALPAYLGGTSNSAGIKWVSSFPDNIEHGSDRASAILVLNSMSTGRPKALMEGSIISAMRTAASAVLAAKTLQTTDIHVAGLVGCGVINFEIARFLLTTNPEISALLLFDQDPQRAVRFKQKFERLSQTIEVRVVENLGQILQNTSLVSFATTAANPYVADLSVCPHGTVILHISLRDLTSSAILSCENIVDDVDHVSRAQTSIHLAEQSTGNRSFIRSTLGEILNGTTPRSDPDRVVVFSPFGLGILDVALGEFALDRALAKGRGHVVPSFFPASWNRIYSA
ncbi:MAG TPA: 2,3-diaminopropionate biosynthesis protein SbnB [Edaphobacter sp.]|nr:2,3-diaminopropionate biosynthesis protein SbnB [Edaphobacter sp.]